MDGKNVVKDYILENGLESLKNDLGIQIKEYDNYFCLNYSQIDSPKTHPVVVESRGCVIDKKSLEFLCRPFSRFFNYGESGCPTDIDFSECSVHEKVDGSLIKLWFNPYTQEWEIGTRGTAHAEGEVGGWGITFRDLFLRSTKISEKDFKVWCDSLLFKNYTYMFELACRENRVVTPYKEDTLVFLGWRNLRFGASGTFAGEDCLQKINARSCEKWPLKTSKEVEQAIDTLEGLQEGFVVYRKGVPVCKIKTPLYVYCHYIRGEGLNPKKIVDILWENQYDEYVSYFPEDEKCFKPYQEAIDSLNSEVKSLWKQFRRAETQKEFALGVKDYPVSGILFNMRKGDTLAQALEKVSKNYRLEVLEPYLGG